jgi:hypothetical protein
MTLLNLKAVAALLKPDFKALVRLPKGSPLQPKPPASSKPPGKPNAR